MCSCMLFAAAVSLCSAPGEVRLVECHRRELPQVFQEMDLTDLFIKFVEPCLLHV